MKTALKRARARPLLGTLVTVWAQGPAGCVREGISNALDEVEGVHRRMSFFDPASEVSLLNQRAHREPVNVHRHTARVLEAGLRLSHLSRGVFDVTVGGPLGRAGFLPTRGQLSPAGGSFSQVRVGANGEVRFLKPLWIDLGGIAKGYAVDLALAALRRAGVHSGGVNAGGDMAFFSDRAQPVWVRHPTRVDRFIPLGPRKSGALATSAPSYHARAGKRGVPYFSKGRRVSARSGVTVSAPRALWADGLTKVALMAPNMMDRLGPLFGARAFFWDNG
ncbi:MAG: FAD:protein FMN transferase [Elusimicrobia bacterium]|nr:FAD:protein FMN transferase [Elusimicrobiota bacterium]